MPQEIEIILRDLAQWVRFLENNVNTAFFAFLLEILLIIIIAAMTSRRVSYASIATNGVVVTMAGGTLLYDKKPIGFVLLAYAALLMTAGVREHIEKKFAREEWFGKLLLFIGHYTVVGLVLITILILEYILI